MATNGFGILNNCRYDSRDATWAVWRRAEPRSNVLHSRGYSVTLRRSEFGHENWRCIGQSVGRCPDTCSIVLCQCNGIGGNVWQATRLLYAAAFQEQAADPAHHSSRYGGAVSCQSGSTPGVAANEFAWMTFRDENSLNAARTRAQIRWRM